MLKGYAVEMITLHTIRYFGSILVLPSATKNTAMCLHSYTHGMAQAMTRDNGAIRISVVAALPLNHLHRSGCITMVLIPMTYPLHSRGLCVPTGVPYSGKLSTLPLKWDTLPPLPWVMVKSRPWHASTPWQSVPWIPMAMTWKAKAPISYWHVNTWQIVRWHLCGGLKVPLWYCPRHVDVCPPPQSCTRPFCL